VLAAVEIAKAWQARLKDLQSALKKAEKLELAPRPRDFSGSSADWKQRAKVQREQTVARFRMRVEQHETTGRALHDALSEMAHSRGLGDVPAWNDKLHAAWSSWLARHQGELPERLAPAPAND
jgi:1,4-alpha-glucan branching enzyme